MKLITFNSVFEWLKEDKKWLLIGIPLLILLVIVFLSINHFNRFSTQAGNSIIETSQNAECGNEIQEALLILSQNMNMPYNIKPDDFKILFSEGLIQKEYYRDGKLYTVYFNLAMSDQGCFFKIYKIKESVGRQVKTTLSDVSIKLNKCQCE